MTMRRRVPRRSVRTRRVGKTSWENLNFSISLTAAASQVISDLTPEPMQTTHEGVGLAVIQRMIAHVDFGFNATDVSAAAHDFAIGIGVVTLDAFAAGAVPDPLSNFDQDWYYWTHRQFKRTTAAEQALASFDFEIRSKRRLRGGYALVMVVENPVQLDAMNVNIAMRNLWNQQA